MAVWPREPFLEPFPTIWPGSVEAIGLELASRQQLIQGATSGTWPAASRLFAFPFSHLGRAPFVIVNALWFNGATISGNVECALYDATFHRLATTGAVAQAAANAVQAAPLAYTLRPGMQYHLALVSDSGTATFFRLAPNSYDLYGMGCWQQSTAYPAPATATPVANINSYLPLFGISRRSFT